MQSQPRPKAVLKNDSPDGSNTSITCTQGICKCGSNEKICPPFFTLKI